MCKRPLTPEQQHRQVPPRGVIPPRRFVVLCLWLLAGCLPFSGQAGERDCKGATTVIEKHRCGFYKLSRLKSKVQTFYQLALAAVDDPDALKAEQRQWLEGSEQCDTTECRITYYDRRFDELRVLAAGHKRWRPPPAMTQAEIQRRYVDERRKTLKAFFARTPLKTTAVGGDNPLCEDFMRDFSAQNKTVELIAPEAVLHDYDHPRLQEEIFRYCPDLELRSYKVASSGPYVGPRNFLLYRVNIDNNLSNAKELLYLEEAMWMREPDYGPEIVAKDRFRLIDLSICGIPGFSAIGASRRYPVDYDVSEEDPQTGLHGVVRYQGKYFLYDVIQLEPKAAPLTLVQYDLSASGNFKMRCLYHNRRNR